MYGIETNVSELVSRVIATEPVSSLQASTAKATSEPAAQKANVDKANAKPMSDNGLEIGGIAFIVLPHSETSLTTKPPQNLVNLYSAARIQATIKGHRPPFRGRQKPSGGGVSLTDFA